MARTPKFPRCYKTVNNEKEAIKERPSDYKKLVDIYAWVCDIQIMEPEKV